MISSETRLPESITFLAAMPSGVPAAIAARSMSPVDTCGIECACVMKVAWVPLPAPGGPRRISRMKAHRRADQPTGNDPRVLPAPVPCRRRLPDIGAPGDSVRKWPVGQLRWVKGFAAAKSARTRSRSSGVSTPGRRRAVGDLDDDAESVPERAELFERLEALDRRRRQASEKRAGTERDTRRARNDDRSAGPRGTPAAPPANASRAHGMVARLKYSA